jgi:hypothetical protein
MGCTETFLSLFRVFSLHEKLFPHSSTIATAIVLGSGSTCHNIMDEINVCVDISIVVFDIMRKYGSEVRFCTISGWGMGVHCCSVSFCGR